MNVAHLHLLLTHLPVLGTLFGLGLGAYALLLRKPDVLKAALGVFVLAGLTAGAAYLTGEGAEETAEGLGIDEAYVERHEEAAGRALLGAGALGVMALAGLAFSRGKPVGSPVAFGALALGAVVMGLMAYTANLGGQIRHAEIRAGGALASAREGVDPGPALLTEREAGGGPVVAAPRDEARQPPSEVDEAAWLGRSETGGLRPGGSTGPRPTDGPEHSARRGEDAGGGFGRPPERREAPPARRGEGEGEGEGHDD